MFTFYSSTLALRLLLLSLVWQVFEKHQTLDRGTFWPDDVRDSSCGEHDSVYLYQSGGPFCLDNLVSAPHSWEVKACHEHIFYYPTNGSKNVHFLCRGNESTLAAWLPPFSGWTWQTEHHYIMWKQKGFRRRLQMSSGVNISWTPLWFHRIVPNLKSNPNLSSETRE